MAKIRYVGLVRPEEAFAALRPFRAELIRMKIQHRPFGPDYLVLDAVMQALDAAAGHFTGQPDFYAAKPGTPRS